MWQTAYDSYEVCLKELNFNSVITTQFLYIIWTKVYAIYCYIKYFLLIQSLIVIGTNYLLTLHLSMFLIPIQVLNFCTWKIL